MTYVEELFAAIAVPNPKNPSCIVLRLSVYVGSVITNQPFVESYCSGCPGSPGILSVTVLHILRFPPRAFLISIFSGVEAMAPLNVFESLMVDAPVSMT